MTETDSREIVPPSYEVSMQQLEDAQTQDELEDALQKAAEAFVREKL